MAEEREHGVAATFDFPLVVFGSTDADFSTGVTFDVSAGDIRLSKDGSTWAPINDTTPTLIGLNSGIYSLDLDSTEMTTARAVIIIQDQSGTKVWEDQAIIINTYGSTAGLHAFNRNTTGVNVNSIDIAAITSTAFAAAALNSTAFADDFLTAGKIASAALTTDEISAGVFTKIWAESTRSITLLGVGSITSTAFAADSILSTAIGDGALVAAKFGVGFITSTGFAAGAINSTAIAADTIIAEKIATDAITAAKIASAALTTDEIAAGVFTKIWAESTRSLTALGFVLAESDFGVDALSTANISTGTFSKIRDEIMPTQNVALDNIEFLFVGSTDHVTPVTGTTGVGTRSIDGTTFVAVEGTIAEVGVGIYQFDASASDMNGGIITFRFTGGIGGNSCGPDDRFVTIVTGGGV